jgi:hypothetical protein
MNMRYFFLKCRMGRIQTRPLIWPIVNFIFLTHCKYSTVIADDELERMLKEVIMACFKESFCIHMGRLRKSTKYLSWDDWFPTLLLSTSDEHYQLIQLRDFSLFHTIQTSYGVLLTSETPY